MVKRSTKLGVDKAKKPAKAKTAKAPPPPEKPATTQAEINRIGDIIKNARGTWFGLLGALVFAAVTLASVKDASFFIPSEQTKLPLLGISVPITSFFWAGALLVTALYTYLHLYLVQLWDALGDADPQFDGKPLADAIHPWLVSDAALRVRDKKRKAKDNEHCSRQRGMSWVSTLVSILLVWFFGLITIGFFWWRSMPAHDIWLTGWLAFLSSWSLYVFWKSAGYALEVLGEDKSLFPKINSYVICVLVIVSLSFVRTKLDIGIQFLNLSSLARADFSGVRFVRTPPNWLGKDLAKQEYRVRWCKLMKANDCSINPLEVAVEFFEDEENHFNSSWNRRWKEMLSKLEKPNFRSFPLKGSNLSQSLLIGANLWNMDIQQANLSGANMSDADLSYSNLQYAELTTTNLQGADLSVANMQETNLRDTNMQNAKLWSANMRGADLSRAKMQGANLNFSEMQGAKLTEAKMQGADLKKALMQGTNLSDAMMQGVDLSGASMQRANLSRAHMAKANLRYVNLEGANLGGAVMQETNLNSALLLDVRFLYTDLPGANLSFAALQGTSENPMKLYTTNLKKAIFMGVSLRFVDFSEAIVDGIENFDKSFGDGSVKLTEGMIRPKGWCKQVLSDEQYWGRYRGWLQEHELDRLFDKEITKHPLIPFGTPCPEE